MYVALYMHIMISHVNESGGGISVEYLRLQ